MTETESIREAYERLAPACSRLAVQSLLPPPDGRPGFLCFRGLKGAEG